MTTMWAVIGDYEHPYLYGRRVIALCCTSEDAEHWKTLQPDVEIVRIRVSSYSDNFWHNWQPYVVEEGE